MIRKLVLVALVLALPLSPQSRKELQPIRGITVYIEAEAGWQNSGVELRAGQRYSVAAYGRWVSGTTEPVGPEGDETGTITNDALLGMLSRTRPERLGYKSFQREIIGRIIRIGAGGRFRSPSDGYLWLAMGDWSGCKECSGTLEVQIVVFN
jgi:hypothetical protein